MSLQVTEEALRLASTQQSNTTKVATVHLQKLEAQVTELTRARDQLTEKMGRISHEYTLQSNAMANLNGALEGFQSQKDNEMKWAEKDFSDRYVCWRPVLEHGLELFFIAVYFLKRKNKMNS